MRMNWVTWSYTVLHEATQGYMRLYTLGYMGIYTLSYIHEATHGYRYLGDCVYSVLNCVSALNI